VVRPDKVKDVLANQNAYLDKLRKLASIPRQEFLGDFTKVESAKHLLQISIECCLDVSNHIIASEGFRAPKSYAESFKILTEQGILPEEYLPVFQQMAQFRNRLVHLYWEIDDEVLYEVLQKDLGDFDIFVKHVLDYIAGQESG
jgi:uncharacterized protein YutE (UPF0331/DUF86 family)